MNREQQYFIECLSDHLRGRETEKKSIDGQALCTYARQQQCEGIIYVQTQLPSMTSLFVQNSCISVNRRETLREIDSLFHENGIPYLIFKGTEVAAKYPVPELRSMSDSDIMVHSADKEKAGRLLESMGMKNKSRGSCEWIYYMDNMEFELHSHLMNDELVSQPEHRAFMEDVWSHATTEDGIEYHIDWDYHLAYLFLHLRKHLMNSGVGFRQFMDIAVVSGACEIDWEKEDRLFGELGISAFVYKCYSLIRRWFGVKVPLEIPEAEEAFYEAATNKIFDGGVFGFADEDNKNNYSIIQVTKDSKISVALKTLFPPYEKLSAMRQYAFLKNRKYLLPAAWIYRFVYSFKKKTTLRVLGDVKRNMDVSSDKIEEREEYLRQWGLTV